MPTRSALEHAQILLPAEDLHRLVAERGRHDALDEHRSDRFGGGAINRNREGDHRPKGRQRIAGERFPVGLESRRSHGQSARRAVLDNGAALLIGKWIGSQERPLEIEKIVEGQLLAPLLLQSGQSVAHLVEIERGILTRILPVTQRLPTFHRDGESGWEPFTTLLGEPRRYGAVVGGGVRVDLLSQQSAKVGRALVTAQGVQHLRVVVRVHHNPHRVEVFGRRAQHGRATDVDVLDHVFGRHVGARGRLAKGIEVDADEVDGGDGMLGDRRHVFRQVAPSKEASVHRRVQRLHAPVQHFGKVGDIGDVAHGQSGAA